MQNGSSAGSKFQAVDWQQEFEDRQMRLAEKFLVENELDTFTRRMTTAPSMERRKRYAKRINSLKAKLTYLTIENS